ncbi:L-glutamate gamma-semialdehyde dehydrogenase [Paramaledivibacter caminithermalis]|jgi:1-pyrroline-5-carboxylate dehydrogenase|uniref:L-glutamate gamma-semialdehyde dehydrogenase n=1 Tax=Paramaledivibacter caminithermalis (strain DSM 15212 / CIP 107654 / DViRD3) TaxID=1121301 RepID=A0A1M6PW91_PARC5|nr:L-glutamate gamma-semialdehyde dehydrogenase [Paramaledivibacter caminithermalis]SHK12157.1 delta-1-pyrroline-5-carboxylate dehydrogenase [Paramaledivibacter caminithermalis DSM 15212]
MINANFRIKTPQNESVLSYAKESDERIKLKARLTELKKEQIEIPLIIGGKEIYTGNTQKCVIPHDKNHVLAIYHMAGEREVEDAIEASLKAKKEWDKMPWQHRASIFLKAAELLSGPWRFTLNAATMLGQSKTAYQAEIDSACELIDFLRFNTYFMSEIYNEQLISTNESWNRIEYRSLEGFVFSVTPFNFTAIGGNLGIAPALMGNVVLWKPAGTSVYSNYFVMKLLQEAGLPDGVINFVPGSGSLIGNVVFNNEWLAGVHFTGSTKVFNGMWKTIGENIGKYRSYPRIVGETGGKDFIFAHKLANINKLVTALIRGAFEYQGQKCSAVSRAYIPRSIWSVVKCKLISECATIKMGDVEDFTNFMGAVIDKNSFDRIKAYIEFAHNSDEAEVIWGGNCDERLGYFIEPTIIVTKNPYFKTMTEEIFGPVLTIYVYEDEKFQETLKICNDSTPYALTGGIFSQDRMALVEMENILTYAAGNLYINDKPTGAVVGQQPFGGGRASGTNDKAGSKLNLLRWTNPRVIKENFNPPSNYRYPFMEVM